MSIEKTITELLEKGVGPLIFGKPPRDSGPEGKVPNFYISAEHNIPTGTLGNALKTQHQAVGATVHEALNQLVEIVQGVEGMRAKPSEIVKLPDGRAN